MCCEHPILLGRQDAYHVGHTINIVFATICDESPSSCETPLCCLSRESFIHIYTLLSLFLAQPYVPTWIQGNLVLLYLSTCTGSPSHPIHCLIVSLQSRWDTNVKVPNTTCSNSRKIHIFRPREFNKSAYGQSDFIHSFDIYRWGKGPRSPELIEVLPQRSKSKLCHVSRW